MDIRPTTVRSVSRVTASINTASPTEPLYLVRRAGRHLDQHSQHHESNRAQVAQYRRQFSLQGNEFLSTGAPNPIITATTSITCRPISNTSTTTPISATAGGSTPRPTPPAIGTSKTTRTAPPSTSVAAKPSGVDKLNGYRHAGDTVTLSETSKWGIFRTGVWYDWAYTDRYQIPSNVMTWATRPWATSTNTSSPRPSSPLPNTNGTRCRNSPSRPALRPPTTT